MTEHRRLRLIEDIDFLSTLIAKCKKRNADYADFAAGKARLEACLERE